MTEPAPKKEAPKKKPADSPKATYNVQKVGKKGTKSPRQIIITREGVQCTSAAGVTWQLPNGSIISLQPTDPEGKSFTMTAIMQKKFECEDGKTFKKLSEAVRLSGNAMSNLDDSLKNLGLSPTATLMPISSKGGAAAETTAKSGSVSLADFELLHVVGKGSFGKVFQVKKKSDGQIYALKVLKKIDLYNKRQIEHTLTERKILETISHPFMPRLRYAFQSPTKLYMVIDYANGGEIFYHLRRAQRFPEVLAIFYCAEIVSSIHHLHSKSIIYRDLKPENVLLDSDGHVKITDFGLAKIGITSVGGESDGEKTMTFCGTPEYIAPEILQGLPHGKAVDWWSTGVMFYEMLVGLPPFYSQNRQEMFQAVMKQPVTVPDFVSADAKDFLLKLLEKRPEKRLGSGAAEGEEIKNHPIFKGIDWAKLEKRQLSPPFKPKFKDGIMDISNIDKQFLSEPLVDSPVPPLPASIADTVNKHFANFEYNQDTHSAGAARPAAAAGAAPARRPVSKAAPKKAA